MSVLFRAVISRRIAVSYRGAAGLPGWSDEMMIYYYLYLGILR